MSVAVNNTVNSLSTLILPIPFVNIFLASLQKQMQNPFIYVVAIYPIGAR